MFRLKIRKAARRNINGSCALNAPVHGAAKMKFEIAPRLARELPCARRSGQFRLSYDAWRCAVGVVGGGQQSRIVACQKSWHIIDALGNRNFAFIGHNSAKALNSSAIRKVACFRTRESIIPGGRSKLAACMYQAQPIAIPTVSSSCLYNRGTPARAIMINRQLAHCVWLSYLAPVARGEVHIAVGELTCHRRTSLLYKK